jgi:phosphoglycerol transferase MdoB-like AlkP superfamily enzyme
MNKPTTIETGIKKLLVFLGLLIVSPLVLSIAFKALRAFKDAPKVFIAYGLLVVGVLLILFTVYYGFKTFKTILDHLFSK